MIDKIHNKRCSSQNAFVDPPSQKKKSKAANASPVDNYQGIQFKKLSDDQEELKNKV